MIADADAVVDPLAMMVKLFDALVADVAMARVSGENCFASWAEPLGIALVDQLAEVQPFGSLDDACVRKGRDQEENVAEQHVNIQI